MTLISSWGDINANSYISLSAAHSYATTGVLNNSSWTSATTASRETALLEAAFDIDAGQFYGSRYYTEQNLEFPRQGRLDYPWGDQVVVDTSQSDFQRRMQKDVEIAAVYQAIHRLTLSGGNANEHLINRNLGIKSINDTVGPLSKNISYGSGSAPGGNFNQTIAPFALNVLGKYRRGRSVWRG